MANCPNCGYKLKMTDWRPECPKCGVNLMYFQMEERLRADADKAELEHAKAQPKYDRLKAAIYGSPLAIIRLVCLVLPLLSLLLPLGKISIALPFYEKVTTVNAIAVYNAVSNLDIGVLFDMAKSEIIGTPVIFFIVSLVLLLLTVVLILVEFICVIIAFGKKWFPRNIAMGCIGIVLSALSAIFFKLSCDGLNEALPGVFSGSIGVFGVIVVIFAFGLVVLMNCLIKVKKIEVKYTDVSELYLPYNERPSVIAAKEAEKAALEAANGGDAAQSDEKQSEEKPLVNA